MILWVILGMMAIAVVMIIVCARNRNRPNVTEPYVADTEDDYIDSANGDDYDDDDDYDRLHPDGQVWDPDLRMWVDADCDDDDDDDDDDYDRLHPDGQVWDPDLRMWIHKDPEAYTFGVAITSE